MKKALSLILVLAMVLSTFVIGTFSASAEGIVDVGSEAIYTDGNGQKWNVLRTASELATQLGNDANESKYYIFANNISFKDAVAAGWDAKFRANVKIDGNGYALTEIESTAAYPMVLTNQSVSTTYIKNLSFGTAAAPATIKKETGSWVGLFGYYNRSSAVIGQSGHTFENCNFYVDISSDTAATCMGGVIGYAHNMGTVQFNNCMVKGTITSTATENVGGYVGYCYSSSEIKLNNSVNNATVTGKQNVGGFVGMTEGKFTALNCRNYSSVTTSGLYLGGFVGRVKNICALEGCENFGTIQTTNQYVGGFIGGNFNNTTITDSKNHGEIQTPSNGGGIFGYNDTSGTLVIENTVNAGNVSGNLNVGGFSGWQGGLNITLKNCANIGTVTASNNGGRVAGFIAGVGSGALTEVTNCYSFGAVTVGSLSGYLVGDGTNITTSSGNYAYGTGTHTKNTKGMGTILTNADDALELLNNAGYGREFMLDNSGKIVVATPVFRGLQDTEADENGNQKIRLVAAIRSSSYEYVGFKVTYQKNDGEIVDRGSQYCQYVYQSINATEDGKTISYQASDLGGLYIYALSIDEVPTDIGTITFTITPFATKGADTFDGTSYEIVYNNGQFVSMTAVA